MLISLIKRTSKQFKIFLDEIMSLGLQKETEDYSRYIYGRCLNHMLEKFVGQHYRIKKKNYEKRFYEYYFQQIARENGMKLEQFYRPRLYGKKYIPRTYNQEYIRNICMNKSFKEEILKYMENDLIENEKKILETKINELVNQWQKKLSQTSKTKMQMNIICKEIRKKRRRSRYLLPWTISEVMEAIEKIKMRIESTNHLLTLENDVN